MRAIGSVLLFATAVVAGVRLRRAGQLRRVRVARRWRQPAIASPATPARRQAFAGGFALQTPFGPIMTPNLRRTTRPASAAGPKRFAHAMQEGGGRTGAISVRPFHIPYQPKVKRQEVEAIYDYLRTLAPALAMPSIATRCLPLQHPRRHAGLEPAVSSRQAISRRPDRSEEFNRGAYLVEGLGHCGACHTPAERVRRQHGRSVSAGQQDRQLDRPQYSQRSAGGPRQLVHR